MTAPSPADLRAIARQYQAERPTTGARPLLIRMADDLAAAVLAFTDPAHANRIIAAQFRREIAEREASLALVLARGVEDAVGVDADV